jgi:hypothetical protein
VGWCVSCFPIVSTPVQAWVFVSRGEGRSSRQVRSMGLWSLIHGGGGCVEERMVRYVATPLLHKMWCGGNGVCWVGGGLVV